MVQLSSRFDEAVAFARRRHQNQSRKGTAIPYLSHLLATASLVLEAGGDEDQAIAGLLHDVLEDHEHTGVTHEDLVTEFGRRVADIVRDCSDWEATTRPPWRERKSQYLSRLRSFPADSVLVANADKLHNARSILSDYLEQGDDLWSRFNPDSDQLWYYRTLADIFSDLGSPLANELNRVVSQLEVAVSATRAEPDSD